MPGCRLRAARGDRARSNRLPALGLLIVAGLALIGCNTVEPADRENRPRRVENPGRNIPSILRGTIGAETVMLGYEPVVVRGFGLVVGLDGTGSRDIHPDIRAHMISTAARRGIGETRYNLERLSPEDLINSEDTAVVVVEAIIPPGASEGTTFDVRVSADPRTGTSSLEGGRLYTTELRPGRAMTGRSEGFHIAEARGEVFVNPFAEPGATERSDINRSSGRILNGGRVIRDMPLKLQLVNPSHRQAAQIQNAINTRFPQERTQRDRTARAESDSLVEITVPPSYRDRSDEFAQLLRHTAINIARADAAATFVRRTLLENPAQADIASWRWQAIGDAAIPVVRELYDHPEELPRLAAVRAGAKLGDARVVRHLVDMAKTSSMENRLQAIDLLAGMPTNPRVNHALRGLINDDDVDVRLAAYEALLERDDPMLTRHTVDNRFVVDIIDADRPMIYITQTGQPRIALFGGSDIAVNRPVMARMWSNQLMVRGDREDEQIEVYYRRPEDQTGSINEVDPSLVNLIRFLGHRTSVDEPDPGLGLSYARTVGALHQLWRQQVIDADFKADQDRILAAIQRQEELTPVADRPEFSTDPIDPDDEAFMIPDVPPADGEGDPPPHQPLDRSEQGLIDPFNQPSRER